MKSSDVRKKFIDFFASRGHIVKPSDALIPSSDPTMLFTSAGMVPFKDYFAGKRKDLKRAVSSQKCFRTTDIDRIGKTPRHLSFFEMLGNFGFGDYFKKEAIAWSWEFLVGEMRLSESRLYVTVYKDDTEALEIWKKIIDPSRIYKLGDETNFWNMGPTGPCGPCSEIIYDLGESHGCGKKGCDPGCDCARWLEVWNLVFTQFNRSSDGKLSPLPQKNIDTGMGLERLAMVVSGSDDVFGTDLFLPLMAKAASLTGVPLDKNSVALRTIADHARSSLFLMADGISPSNDGRGYVLRRIIRRAQRAGKSLGCDKPFLYEIIPAVCEIMSSAYPETAAQLENVSALLKKEEEKFLETLDSGLAILEEMLKNAKHKKLSGKDAFNLYETYGFPYDMTRDICAERGIAVDDGEFAEAEDAAKKIARASWKGVDAVKTTVYEEIKTRIGATVFTGYDGLSRETAVAALLSTAGPSDKISAGDAGEVFLKETPFYAESGGQSGDSGRLIWSGGEAVVADVRKAVDGLSAHGIKVTKGELSVGQKVRAEVDPVRRKDIARHHTATHLLHKALRETLGRGAVQSGSLVAPDYLRFDFAHSAAPAKEQLDEIERKVNEAVRADFVVRTTVDDLDAARKKGAMALFGEKYGNKVRMVEVGAEHSLELCGGTHVGSTGEIGFFKIISESSVGSGLRRITAVCGKYAEDYVRDSQKLLDEIAGILKASRADVALRAAKLFEHARELEKRLSGEAAGAVAAEIAAAASRAKAFGGVRLAFCVLEDRDAAAAGPAAAELLKALGGEGVALAAAARGESFAYAVAVSPSAADDPRMAATAVAKRFASAASAAGGGGKPTFARGGGKNVAGIKKGIASVEEYLAEITK
ncbi:MAG: alanine--tRNA ligase [Elusimicrobia bacterium HGW-Elusimicrobia-1]|jgi:alanyl-tRNA synthetase|nr:MAG: alanine--tRNA ligase [Elusimicrobia bacterium HGW-Elusimicrobia-1]